MQDYRLMLVVLFIVVIVSACSTQTPTDAEAVSTEVEATEAETEGTETVVTPGEALFVEMIDEVGFACATCHYLTEARLIGPGLGNLATRFESYGLDMTLEEYVLESIINPANYVVETEPEYPHNIMPNSYSTIFTEEQLNDLVAYILSL